MARKISVFAGQVEEQDQKNKLVELTEMFLLRRPGRPHRKKQPEQPLPSLGRRGNRGHPVDRRRRSSPPRRDHVRVQVSDAERTRHYFRRFKSFFVFYRLTAGHFNNLLS